MSEKFADILAVGGKSNSLGRANEVIECVLRDKSRLDELYGCLFNEDAWIRMRAADALEKICRIQPNWVVPYIDKLLDDLTKSSQPSIQWHLAQILGQVDLTNEQKTTAISWLEDLLSSYDIDWIAAANAVDTLVQFTKDGSFPTAKMISLLQIQQQHKSNAVVKRATRHLTEINNR